MAMDPVTTKLLISAGTQILGGMFGRKKRRREARQAQAEMEKYKQEYLNLDFSNPYTGMENQYKGMENSYEDLTVNLKQADFMANQQAQRDVNILDSLQGAAGGSGVAGLAQSVYNQKVKKGQQAAGSIGLQEASNQRLAARGQSSIDLATRKEDARLQNLERSGDVYQRQQEQKRTETLYSMSMNRSAAAKQSSNSLTKSIIGGVGSAFTDYAGSEFGAEQISNIFDGNSETKPKF
jgi:hypothetical protein|tara:strand:- start:1305 stop:2015 length:711 start_codon:yes stop_codon:yes gene_type:complete